MKLLNSIRVAFEECYIKDGALALNGAAMCFSTTLNQLKIFDIRTGAHMLDIGGHTATITDLVSSHVDPNMLYSSQVDTGVMVSDLRVGKGVHWLTEMTQSGQDSYSLTVNPTGLYMALAVNGDIHIIDTRTWASVNSFLSIHCDEITRIRYCNEFWLASGGEDGMFNVIDTTQKENDMMLNVVNTQHEVVEKMKWFPEHNCVTATCSTECSWIVPLVEGVFETKVPRRDYDSYVVDYVNLADGRLALVMGTKGEEGAGPLEVVCAMPGPDFGKVIAILPHGHREISRVAMTVGNTLITGAEDGVVCCWDMTPSANPAEQVNGLNNDSSPVEVASTLESIASKESATLKAGKGSDRMRQMKQSAGKPY